MIYTGSCHCKKVRFEVEAPENLEVELCNCSICKKSGFLHLIVPLSKFTIISGEEQLNTYTFNTGVAKHTFCNTCGIKPFYTPRSNPDGVDVNVNCFDTHPESVTITKFDGASSWDNEASKLAYKSKN